LTEAGVLPRHRGTGRGPAQDTDDKRRTSFDAFDCLRAGAADAYYMTTAVDLGEGYSGHGARR